MTRHVTGTTGSLPCTSTAVAPPAGSRPRPRLRKPSPLLYRAILGTTTARPRSSPSTCRSARLPLDGRGQPPRAATSHKRPYERRPLVAPVAFLPAPSRGGPYRATSAYLGRRRARRGREGPDLQTVGWSAR